MKDLNNANEETGEFREEAVKLIRKLQAENVKLRIFAQFVLDSITDTQNAGYTLTCPPKYLRRGAEKVLEAKQ